jgi:hypothetical protein
LLFFGAPNQRRAEIIRRLRDAGVAVQEARKKTFGEALRAAMVSGSAVLNLHFDDGIYSEAPRILKAMLAGLPLVSEDLAPPFQPGVHYLTLDQAAADARLLADTYANLARTLCTGYSLAGFLRRVAQDRRAVA